MKTWVQMILYLAAGGWNTVFGLGLYWLAYHLFGQDVNYLLLFIPVNVLAVTNAFLCYKIFVFRTKGHWWSEYFKCYLIYGGGMAASMVLLWLLVDFGHMHPVVANFAGTGLVVVGSYFGHKYFSFSHKR